LLLVVVVVLILYVICCWFLWLPGFRTARNGIPSLFRREAFGTLDLVHGCSAACRFLLQYCFDCLADPVRVCPHETTRGRKGPNESCYRAERFFRKKRDEARDDCLLRSILHIGIYRNWYYRL